MFLLFVLTSQSAMPVHPGLQAIQCCSPPARCSVAAVSHLTVLVQLSLSLSLSTVADFHGPGRPVWQSELGRPACYQVKTGKVLHRLSLRHHNA